MNKDGTVTITTTGSQTRTTSLRTLAMMRRCSDLSASQIVQEALKIAGDICIYTNHEITVETLPLENSKKP